MEKENKYLIFFKQNWTYLLVLIPLILTIYVRMLPAELPIVEDWARSNIYNFYRSQIGASVNSQYPDMPDEQKQQAIEQSFSDYISKNSDIINQQVEQSAKQIKSQMMYDENSKEWIYLGDIDSYYYLRQARNYLEKGTICDEVKDGKCYDTYTLAPNKLGVGAPSHPYAIVYVYKFLKFFNKDITLMQASFYTPLVFSLFVVIMLFILMKKLSGIIGALVATVLVSFNPTFLARTLGSDTDVYNLFFPVLIIWLAFEAFRAVKLKTKIIYSILTAVGIGLYNLSWLGWWYLFYFIIIALVFDVFYYILKERKTEKSLKNIIRKERFIGDITILAVMFILTGIIITLMSSFWGFFSVIYSPFYFMTVKAAANPTLWPNVLTTVAEFNSASTEQIIGSFGYVNFLFFSAPFFLLALFGLILMIYGSIKSALKNWMLVAVSVIIYIFLVTKKGIALGQGTYLFLIAVPVILALYAKFREEKEIDAKIVILLLLWVISTIYASNKGVRFILLMIVPLAICVGIFSDFVYRFMLKLFPKNKQNYFVKFIVALPFIFMLIAPLRTGIAVASSYAPNVNDQWNDALTYIKENSKPEAIINSWWDFGHWFKYIADRRVTLDGSSQNSPQLHWLGKILKTSDENEAVGILRMLDCGGNNAFDEIDNIKNNIPESIFILNEIILLDKNGAEKKLDEHGFSKEQIKNILQYTHCNPPENFFITSSDMVGKAGVWSHFGNWDFKKAMMHQIVDSNKKLDAIKILASEFNITKNEAEQTYNEITNLKIDEEVNAWISPWYGYHGGGNCRRYNESVDSIYLCDIENANIKIDIEKNTADIMTANGIMHPNSISIMKDNSVDVKIFENNTLGFSIAMINENGNYRIVVTGPYLAESMFTRLFYMKGIGLKYFDLAIYKRDVSGSDIYVWKVDWKGKK